MNRYVLALDLVNNKECIEAYEYYHQNVWPEIKDSILASGILEMEIYRIENRLFMIIEVNKEFSFEKKALMDGNNIKVQEWEQLMSTYQVVIPGAAAGEKWVLMKKIFEL